MRLSILILVLLLCTLGFAESSPHQKKQDKPDQTKNRRPSTIQTQPKKETNSTVESTLNLFDSFNQKPKEPGEQTSKKPMFESF